MRRGGGREGRVRRGGGREEGEGRVRRGGGGKGVFDQVLVEEEIKRWTHYGRQADVYVHCPTSGKS